LVVGVAKPTSHWEALLIAIARLLVEQASQSTANIVAAVLDQALVINRYAAEWTRYRHAAHWLDQVCRYLNMELASNRPSKGTLLALQAKNMLPALKISRRVRVEAVC
jgi:hypothetical protein